MTVKECYQVIGDYREACDRLGNDQRICKYLDKFRRDTSFFAFCRALEEEDYKQAFICIHNLKGLYLNLSLSFAGSCASELCEKLRNGRPEDDISALVAEAKRNHEQAVQAVNELLDDRA